MHFVFLACVIALTFALPFDTKPLLINASRVALASGGTRGENKGVASPLLMEKLEHNKILTIILTIIICTNMLSLEINFASPTNSPSASSGKMQNISLNRTDTNM